MSEWQPIETAPKDTTTIIAASPKRADAVTILWDVTHNEWRSNCYPFTSFEDTFFTHWKEAPEPPPTHQERGER